MKQIIIVILSTILFTSCNTESTKHKAMLKDSPYPSAEIYLGGINKAKNRIHSIGSQKFESPKTENEYQINDSLLNLESIALDNYIQSLVDAYGNIPTDSIFENIKDYGGYIPPVIFEKIQASDWSTNIGKLAKENYNYFFEFYAQFDSLVGLSVCESDIILRTIEGKELKLCDIVSEGTYLVDIWASWCSTCRSFNRNFKKHYSFFKKRGVETISISTDKSVKRYQLAAHHDNVPWSDFHDFSGELSKTLNIQALPFQFLVKDGEIIEILFFGSTEAQLKKYISSNNK